MLTFDEWYDEQKDNIISSLVVSYFAKYFPRKSGEPKKQYRKKREEFREVYQSDPAFIEYCRKNSEYRKFFSEKAIKDGNIQDQYAKYCAEARKKEAHDQTQKLIKTYSEKLFNYFKTHQSLLDEAVKQITEEYQTALKDIFSQERIYFLGYSNDDDLYRPYRHHRNGSICSNEINAHNYGYFLSEFCLDTTIAEMYDSILDDSEDVLQLYINYFRSHADGFNDIFSDDICNDLDQDVLADIYTDVRDMMDRDRILEDYLYLVYVDTAPDLSADDVDALIRRNPHYTAMLEAKDREDREREELLRRMEQGILKRIPDNPVDIFPLARTMTRHFILHIGPTNSGKTYAALSALKAAENGVYLAPLRLLAYECYEDLNNSGVPCSLVTGEEVRLTDGAKHTASTVELLNIFQKYDVAVIDEAQMLADDQRGWAWTDAIMGVCADEIHICAAPHAEGILCRLIDQCGDEYTITRHDRDVPLQFDGKKFSFPESVREHDALICFSKANVLSVAAELQSQGVKSSIIYGALPYEVRQNEVNRFVNGETDVIVATDAIGMGMNLPIERIVFLETKKYDGTSRRDLTSAEIQQIAGRAGRRGIYDIGWFTAEYGQGKLKSKYDRTVHNIPTVYLGFSKNLISVDGKLSDIIKQWAQLPDNGIFKKINAGALRKLCLELEKYTDDKELMYSFLTIPFDDENRDLHNTWLNAFLAEHNGKHYSFTAPATTGSLNELEEAYKYCDLMFFYLNRFTDGEQLDEISTVKQEITEEMMRMLATQHLPTRKCRECGCHLAWNYPYNICEPCYQKRQMYYGYNDWDW